MSVVHGTNFEPRRPLTVPCPCPGPCRQRPSSVPRGAGQRQNVSAARATVFQRFVNSPHGTVTHLFVDMRVQGVGELTDDGSYWRLVYDECGHVQALAREGLADPAGAAFFVRRHYAECLTCALSNRPVAAETPNVALDQIHLVLSADELVAIVSALRSSDRAALAERLDEVLRQLGRAR